jgi:hypothetical protein
MRTVFMLKLVGAGEDAGKGVVAHVKGILVERLARMIESHLAAPAPGVKCRAVDLEFVEYLSI